MNHWTTLILSATLTLAGPAAWTTPLDSGQVKRMDDTKELFAAVAAGDDDKIEKLLAGNPALAKAKNETGVPVILAAVFMGKKPIAERIAVHRTDLDIFEATALGNSARVKHLVGSDKRLAAAFGADGFTALHYAAHYGYDDILKFLVEKGADPAAVSRNGLKVMPLQSAVAGGQTNSARLLLDRGAPVNARQEESGTTALHVAAVTGKIDLVELLIERGADVTACQAGDGKTPLDLALEKGQTAVAEILRKRGAR